ncbi:MAG: 5-formyltetrahydrofolate cyclo-ligase [Pseudomonadota bacterium]|nr:5-formyltetrahydrofolate cyclo-ligase [Pseudomonadota bacterium]
MRKNLLKVRLQIASSENSKRADRILAANFLSNMRPKSAAVVAGYWPFKNEIDSRYLLNCLHELGVKCLLPVVAKYSKKLDFSVWRPGDKLIRVRFGCWEPKSEKFWGIPDMLVVPTLAFDSLGNRLGYGGGYYDHTIREFRRNKADVVAIGAAYSLQEVARVPSDSGDQKLDAVVTDQGIKSFNSNQGVFG